MRAINLKFDESRLADTALVRRHAAPVPALPRPRCGPGARALALRGWEARLRSEYQGMAFTRWFHGLTIELNAPMDVQELALGMILHEHRHARLCAAAAASLGGAPELAFGPAAFSGGDVSRGPAAAFWETLIGPFMVGEAAALRLLSASIRMLPPSPYRDMLRSIARDESLHARFGYLILADARRGKGWIEPPPDAWIRATAQSFIAAGLERDVVEADEARAFRHPGTARALLRLGIPHSGAFRETYRTALRVDVPGRFRAIGIRL